MVALLSSASVHTHELTTKASENDVADLHEGLIRQKLATYNAEFPDIQFVHFTGGDWWHGEMIALVAVLGRDADPLDYAHSPGSHDDLMAATIDRLARMLRHNVISATTFRLPANNSTRRRNLCIITLNPARHVTDDLETTRHMLNLDKDRGRKIHPTRYLNHVRADDQDAPG